VLLRWGGNVALHNHRYSRVMLHKGEIIWLFPRWQFSYPDWGNHYTYRSAQPGSARHARCARGEPPLKRLCVLSWAAKRLINIVNKWRCH